MSEREPASIIGELIEDEAVRLGGSVGTVTSSDFAGKPHARTVIRGPWTEVSS